MSAGMSTRTAFSNPRSTPFATTIIVISMNTVCQKPVTTALSAKFVKICPTPPASSPVNAPDAPSKIYAAAQPAITL